MLKPVPLLIVVFLLSVGLSGCLQGADPEVRTTKLLESFQVVDDKQQPLPYAQVRALSNVGDDGLLALLSADMNGTVRLTDLPATTEQVIVGAAGFESRSLLVSSLESTIALAPGNGTADGFLRFLPHVNLLCPVVDPPPHTCGRFGEPVVEAAKDGNIWVSATCCIGKAPPIWRSTDGGKSFKLHNDLGTGTLRETFGIEGDFAIDDAGNVYFFDISVASAWFTSWDKTGKHRWTLPVPFLPGVDRPWVRAGQADEVIIAYNNFPEGTTKIYRSTDGGLTWNFAASPTLDCYIGTLGQGYDRKTLYVASQCQGRPKLWTSKDSGLTWDNGQALPLPGGPSDQYVEWIIAPVADEAGNVYVPFTYVPKMGQGKEILLARRAADGTWLNTTQVSPGGQNVRPWPAAGKAGQVGIAWYHADKGEVPSGDDSSEWHLMTAVSIDADQAVPHFQVAIADPDVLTTGLYDQTTRNLGDFLEADLTADGRFIVAYAKEPAAGSDGALNLAPVSFLNGPK